MRRALAAFGTIAVFGVATVVGIADPASATMTVATSGTTMTVTLTGTESIDITCLGGVNTAVDGATGFPVVPCAALTKMTVNGDSGPQTVDGSDLEIAAFSAKPTLTVNLGAGDDIVTDTIRADSLTLGAGEDNLYLVRGVANTSSDMGPDIDAIRFFGTDAAEELTASSSNSTVTVSHVLSGVLRTMTATNAEEFHVGSYGGADEIDLSGITAASSIDDGSIFAGAGDDIVRGPQAGATLSGGEGDNEIYGGAASDNISSEGNGDIISSGGGANFVFDRNSPQSGRTLANVGASNRYSVEINLGDSFSRIRSGTGSNTVVTNSLARTGQQVTPPAYDTVQVSLGVNVAGDARGVIDLVALNASRTVYLRGDQADNDLLDVTIPTGSWTTSGTPATTYFIMPTAGGYNDIQASNVGEVRIHGPWVNKNSGFAHRVTRDLMFRFATGTYISNTAVALDGGNTTRPAVVSALMDTDEYRGLDVDRTFLKYLDRAADSGGRTYWVNSIKNGKALWRFRAQLFGSSEYFNKAGGTNGTYIDRVYQDVLGRLPDPQGRAYWIGKLNAGADRGSVALKFINAAEFRRFLVDEQFLRFLDRRPTSGEQTTWVNKLSTSATGEQELVAALAVGTEYYNRT